MKGWLISMNLNMNEADAQGDIKPESGQAHGGGE